MIRKIICTIFLLITSILSFGSISQYPNRVPSDAKQIGTGYGYSAYISYFSDNVNHQTWIIDGYGQEVKYINTRNSRNEKDIQKIHRNVQNITSATKVYFVKCKQNNETKILAVVEGMDPNGRFTNSYLVSTEMNDNTAIYINGAYYGYYKQSEDNELGFIEGFSDQNESAKIIYYNYSGEYVYDETVRYYSKRPDNAEVIGEGYGYTAFLFNSKAWIIDDKTNNIVKYFDTDRNKKERNGEGTIHEICSIGKVSFVKNECDIFAVVEGFVNDSTHFSYLVSTNPSDRSAILIRAYKGFDKQDGETLIFRTPNYKEQEYNDVKHFDFSGHILNNDYYGECIEERYLPEDAQLVGNDGEYKAYSRKYGQNSESASHPFLAEIWVFDQSGHQIKYFNTEEDKRILAIDTVLFAENGHVIGDRSDANNIQYYLISTEKNDFQTTCVDPDHLHDRKGTPLIKNPEDTDTEGLSQPGGDGGYQETPSFIRMVMIGLLLLISLIFVVYRVRRKFRGHNSEKKEKNKNVDVEITLTKYPYSCLKYLYENNCFIVTADNVCESIYSASEATYDDYSNSIFNELQKPIRQSKIEWDETINKERILEIKNNKLKRLSKIPEIRFAIPQNTKVEALLEKTTIKFNQYLCLFIDDEQISKICSFKSQYDRYLSYKVKYPEAYKENPKPDDYLSFKKLIEKEETEWKDRDNSIKKQICTECQDKVKTLCSLLSQIQTMFPYAYKDYTKSIDDSELQTLDLFVKNPEYSKVESINNILDKYKSIPSPIHPSWQADNERLRSAEELQEQERKRVLSECSDKAKALYDTLLEIKKKYPYAFKDYTKSIDDSELQTLDLFVKNPEYSKAESINNILDKYKSIPSSNHPSWQADNERLRSAEELQEQDRKRVLSECSDKAKALYDTLLEIKKKYPYAFKDYTIPIFNLRYPQQSFGLQHVLNKLASFIDNPDSSEVERINTLLDRKRIKDISSLDDKSWRDRNEKLELKMLIDPYLRQYPRTAKLLQVSIDGSVYNTRTMNSFRKITETEWKRREKELVEKEENEKIYSSKKSSYESIKTNYPDGYKACFHERNINSISGYNEVINRESEIIRKDKEIKERRLVEAQIAKTVKHLCSCVDRWHVTRWGIPHSYLYEYLPTEYEDASKEEWRVRNLIWAFKNDPNKRRNRMFSYEDALNEVVPAYTGKLKETFGTDIPKLTLVCVPASSQERNDKRWKSFAERVCSQLGLENSYDYIKITKDAIPKHLGGTGEAAVQFVNSYFKDKFVILCDDVKTSGNSLLRMKNELESMGANVICALTIGKTIHR